MANERVYVGTRRTYEGVEYRALQEHTTQTDWTPTATLGTLWAQVVITAAWAVGVAYKGDNTQGAGAGDIVTYSGRRYRCLQSHTSIATWYPSAVGIINVLWVDIGAA